MHVNCTLLPQYPSTPKTFDSPALGLLSLMRIVLIFSSFSFQMKRKCDALSDLRGVSPGKKPCRLLEISKRYEPAK
jgi:hypothetical protein